MSEQRVLVRLRGATLGHGGREVLRDVDLDVRTGELLCLVGRNGAGKSTLLAGLMGVLTPMQGEREGAAMIGFAPQRGELDPLYPFLTEEVVAMGLVGRGRRTRAERSGLVVQALTTAGMAARAKVPFRELSGGQRQRTLVARALVAQPELVVLDEPTNDLDVQGRAETVALIRAVHAQGRGVVVVSHDLDLVHRIAERVGVLRDGRIHVVEPDALADEAGRAELLGLELEPGLA